MSQVGDETEPAVIDLLPPVGSENREARGRERATRGARVAAQSKLKKSCHTKNENIVLLPQTSGSGFGQEEVDHFLGLLNQYLPICKDECDFVLAEQNKMFSFHRRTVDGISQKFASLHRKKVPIGNLLMQANVRMEKY